MYANACFALTKSFVHHSLMFRKNVFVVWNCGARFVSIKKKERKHALIFGHFFILHFTDEFSVATAQTGGAIPSDVYHSINESLELKCLLAAHVEQQKEVRKKKIHDIHSIHTFSLFLFWCFFLLWQLSFVKI